MKYGSHLQNPLRIYNDCDFDIKKAHNLVQDNLYAPLVEPEDQLTTIVAHSSYKESSLICWHNHNPFCGI